MGAVPFLETAKQTCVGKVTLHEIDGYIQIEKEEENKDEPLARDEDALREAADLVVPRHLQHDYLDVSSKVNSDVLASYRPCNDRIELDGSPTDLGYHPLYKTSME